MAITSAPGRGYLVTIQNAQTTGNGDVVTPAPQIKDHTFTITGSSGVAAGAVQIESSDDSTYAGTWIPIGTPVTVVVSSKLEVNFTGAYMALRARISTNVTGGTVTVTYTGR